MFNPSHLLHQSLGMEWLKIQWAPKKRTGRPALLGLRATAPFRRRRAAWRQRVAANESAGWFVRWFVCWTSTASSQHMSTEFLPRLKDLKGWTGDPNRLDASQMSQSRGAFTQRDAARSAPWPPLTISVGQEGPTNWESLGITWSHHQKLGYIYIYIHMYIYMDLLWFKQLLAIGFKLNGCDSLSLSIIIYTVRDVSLGGDVTFVTHCGHAVMWLSRTWCDFHERTCSDQLQNEVDGFLSGHCSMDIHWLKEMYGNVVTASRAVSSQYG